MRERTPSVSGEAQVTAPGGPGGEAPRTTPGPGGAPPSWRKRHPTIARIVLYTALLAALAVPAALWIQGRQRYLEARIEQVSLEVQIDPSGAQALKSLESEFSEWGFLPNPALTDVVRARAERLRGVLATLRRDPAEMERAFASARNLDVRQGTVDALVLEWAQCRIDLKDLVGARQLLNAPTSQDPVLALWRPIIQAHLLEADGKGDEARIGLLTLIDKLPKPLPQVPPVWFMLDNWRLVDVMIEAIGWMAAGLRPGSAQLLSLWRRVPEFAPEDVRALVAAAEGLLLAGDTLGARELWSRARSLDPVFVAKLRASKPALGALDTP